MKIGIILSGQDSRTSAGVRIRYERLMPWLEAQGHTLSLTSIDDMDPMAGFRCDAYLFCKCHDVRALVLARAMKRAGVHVGVDFFDDYYTQETNSRFLHLRDWLRSIAPDLTFSLCSTDAIRERLAALLPDVPFHILNDPYEAVDTDSIRQAVSYNAEKARRTRQLDIGWFGMGDNPHLPVGLHDLKAHGEMLLACRRSGYTPRLTILTNRRALSADRLEMIARLGIPFRLEEWSEALELGLVRSSVACLLPVNSQPFSIVKSINRAITTLTGGSQILSAGFPLYQMLQPFVYRDMTALIADIEAGTLALRAETVSHLAMKLQSLADPEQEAKRLTDFLSGTPRPIRKVAIKGNVVIFGRRTSEAAFRQINASNAICVASPFAAVAGRDYDVFFHPDPLDDYRGLVFSKRAASLLPDEIAPFLTPVPKTQQPLFHLPAAALPIATNIAYPRQIDGHVSVDLSQYKKTIGSIVDLMACLFPDRSVFVSEASSPYSHRRLVNRAGAERGSSPVEGRIC